MPFADLRLPVLHSLPPETAHLLTLRALRLGLAGRDARPDDPRLRLRLWGRVIANPVGLAAGFDKDAAAILPLFRLGFGLVEMGTVTPRAQPGNPRPRLFRLRQDAAVINRLGFNNQGLEQAAEALAAIQPRKPDDRLLGANIGKNKDTPAAAAAQDYAAGVARCAALADYLVVNISSPNTPGLRDLQSPADLEPVLDAVLAARADAPRQPPLLVKIAPDLDDAAIVRLVDTVCGMTRDGQGVDGLIVSNTTTARPESLVSRHKSEAGGLSGRPLFARSTEALAVAARVAAGRLPLIGVGGVEDGATAYAKIRAGASAVQLYTALVYHGPGLIRRIKADLAARLAADGFERLEQAIGADLR